MALTNCPSCKGSISSFAKKCPHCKQNFTVLINSNPSDFAKANESNSIKSNIFENTFQNKNSTSVDNYETENNNDYNTPHNRDQNYFALAAAAAMAIAVFLPWFTATCTTNILGVNNSFTSPAISGIDIKGGIAGLILAASGGLLTYLRISGPLLIGLINLIIGVGYILGWFTNIDTNAFSSSISYGDYSAKFSIDLNPQIGIYIFIASSILFIVASFKSND
jgi:hypothetical protein